ncbi:MAG: hypothetical protein R2856_03260 [Caldilineaceae bacterium]
MIKAVIFDVGGVLIRTEDPSPRRRLEDRSGLAPGQAEFIVFNSERGRAPSSLGRSPRRSSGTVSRTSWGWTPTGYDFAMSSSAVMC